MEEESPLVLHTFCDVKILQWHNVLHIVELLLSAGCAGVLAPHITDNDGFTKTGEMFIVYLIYLPFSLVILPVYYNAEHRITRLERVPLGRHWVIRCILAFSACTAYLTQGLIMITLSSVPDQPTLLPELVSGILALVLTVVYIIEALASYQNIKNVSIWELNRQPNINCCCSERREQNTGAQLAS